MNATELVDTCTRLTLAELALVLDAILAVAEMTVFVSPGGPSHVQPRELQLLPTSQPQEPKP